MLQMRAFTVLGFLVSVMESGLHKGIIRPDRRAGKLLIVLLALLRVAKGLIGLFNSCHQLQAQIFAGSDMRVGGFNLGLCGMCFIPSSS